MAETKKRILIFSHAMELGGAERALLGLLHSFDYSKFDVDLFLMRHEGALMEMIPQEVNLLPEVREYTGLAVPFKSILKKRLFGIAFGRLRAKLKAKAFLRRHPVRGDNAVELEYSHKYTCKFMPAVGKKEYDLAVSFLTPHYFVAEKVNAKKRIAWIHTDYSTLSVDVESELKMWDKYDYIASISDDCTKSFLSVFPSLQNKIVLIENIISPKLIQKQAKAFQPDWNSGDSKIVLSVGRFCFQTTFDNVPDICRRIIEDGLNIKWYLIGFGSGEKQIQENIERSGMQDRVFILGKKTNPYPYMENCDVYIQPSRYEGKAVTVREAQILGKPVIITDYPTAWSQIENGIDGVIVPLENENCAKEITRILRDQDLLQMLENNCRQKNYNNAFEVEKLYSIIGL